MKEIKKKLRKQIAQEKSRHTATELTANSIALLNKLEQHPLFIAAKTVLLYYSLGDEVQTHDFIEKWYRQKDILLPVVKGDILELRRYTGPQNLQTGEAYHIEEPTGEAFTDYTQIDFAIIPGVSFDKNGNRLGRGKGYYDRLLPQLHSYNVGICFDFQVSDCLLYTSPSPRDTR